MNFNLEGKYIGITDFIYSLEDDDELKFEIKDFKISSEEIATKSSKSESENEGKDTTQNTTTTNKTTTSTNNQQTTNNTQKETTKKKNDGITLYATFTVENVGIKLNE